MISNTKNKKIDKKKIENQENLAASQLISNF